MKIENIGVMSPGDMGQAVAQQLKNKGFNVRTALDKRSARSRELARQAGLTDVGSIAQLTETCEVILSVMNPGAALDFATEVAQALAANQRKPLFVDCNAISPVTMQTIDARITAAGGRCADGGIIGPPPRGTAKMWLYVSGPEAKALEQLATPQINVTVMSGRIGDASAIKMCYGAFNKGLQAMALEVLVAARRLGVDALLETQLKASRREVYDWIIGALPVMPPKAYRWVPEMLEIAKTFESVGLTPRMFQGTADMYGFVAGTALGKETPENRDKSRGGKDVVRLLADTPAGKR
jgi:3-hydroxyisobutyrate dehydrogenase-like beta-hydroxyacid dehydrogenase